MCDSEKLICPSTLLNTLCIELSHYDYIHQLLWICISNLVTFILRCVVGERAVTSSWDEFSLLGSRGLLVGGWSVRQSHIDKSWSAVPGKNFSMRFTPRHRDSVQLEHVRSQWDAQQLNKEWFNSALGTVCHNQLSLKSAAWNWSDLIGSTGSALGLHKCSIMKIWLHL